MLKTPQDLLNLMNESYADATSVFDATLVRYARGEVGREAVDAAREHMNAAYLRANPVPAPVRFTKAGA
jgi:hypothetical protein